MRYKALIIDFDGTTIKNGQYETPTPRVIEAIQKAKEKLFVCGATGRPLSTAKWVIDPLRLTSPCILSAGTQIVNPLSGDVLWEKSLTEEAIEKIQEICAQYPYDLTFVSQWYTFPPDKTKLPDRRESVAYLRDVPRKDSEAFLEALKQIPSVAVHKVNGYTPDVIDIHITHENATKKHAIEELLSILHLSKEETIGVGDSHNDMPLFESVGLKVAMGNGADELKAQADYVAPSVEDDGLADIIENFILND